MKLLLYTFFVAVGIPFFTFSLDPKNPADACERFIHESDKKTCLAKVSSPDIDWYASSFCEQLGDDKVFLSCFDSIHKAQFDPKAIELCEKMAGTEDGPKMNCLQMVKNKTIGACEKKSTMAELEACLKNSSARLPAQKKNFFQK